MTINIVSIEGDECNIESLSKLAELTGGAVERVNPTSLTKDFANILAMPVIATKVEAKVKLHKGLMFRNENPIDLSDDKTLLTRQFGNVTEENVFTFEYTLKPISELVLMEDLNLEEIKYFPFQTQISYTSLDGAKLLRVITKKMEVSNDREELEKKADFKLISENAMQKGSQMAARGDFRGGQAIMKTYKQKMRQNIQSEAQVADYQNFNKNLALCYQQINEVQAKYSDEEEEELQMQSLGVQPKPSAAKKKVARGDALSTNLFKQAKGGMMSKPSSNL